MKVCKGFGKVWSLFHSLTQLLVSIALPKLVGQTSILSEYGWLLVITTRLNPPRCSDI